MAEGLENLDHFGERLDPIHFGLGVSDQIRSMAIFGDCSPEEVVRRALMFFENHLELERQGWDGPRYERQVRSERRGRLGRMIASTETEVIKCTLVPDNED
jgi:hypothetical protein